VNLFNDTFNELQKISNDNQTTFSPKFDVKESKTSYTLEGEIPGVDQKDVTIEWSDENTVTIKGRTERYYESGDKPSSTAADAHSQKTDNESGDAKKESSSSKEMTTTQKGSTDVANVSPDGHHYWVSERTVGSFARSFSFPGQVDHDGIKASLKNGILSIVIPKREKKPTSKRIAIE
jgi:HSP20 family molecular chaperone IbpA